MAYFKRVPGNNTRRFKFTDPDAREVTLAIYDSCKSWTKYAAVEKESDMEDVFISEPRCYFPDQIEEIVT